ncbi:MAG: hypothetical protein J7526_20980, partial [Roseofilum sp. Belize Diploria]
EAIAKSPNLGDCFPPVAMTILTHRLNTVPQYSAKRCIQNNQPIFVFLWLGSIIFLVASSLLSLG